MMKLSNNFAAAATGLTLLMGSGALATPAFADENPQEQTKVKTTYSMLLYPGQTGTVTYGCGGSNSYLKGIDLDSIQSERFAKNEIAKNYFRADKVEQGRLPNEVKVTFSNTQPKSTPAAKRRLVQLELTIVCSNVNPGKFPEKVSIENEMTINGSPDWGTVNSGLFSTPCPSSHPFHSDSAVTVESEDREVGIVVADKKIDRSVYPNVTTYDILNYNEEATSVSTFVFCGT
ncbi:hypothetical protein [Streptomyces sp. NPDC088752]|uniref:hypothetical protein n=1 Tax=Streptomyces sp. NPDC088752 TaxID=3154963 RepID=UPI003448EA3E